MTSHNKKGKEGEATAVEYLQKKGFAILETNWRYERAEIDVIAKWKESIIFIEVKMRSTVYFGLPEEAVTPAKQRHLLRAAEAYLEEKNISGEVRFDVISIVKNEREQELYHIEDAFFPIQ